MFLPILCPKKKGQNRLGVLPGKGVTPTHSPWMTKSQCSLLFSAKFSLKSTPISTKMKRHLKAFSSNPKIVELNPSFSDCPPSQEKCSNPKGAPDYWRWCWDEQVGHTGGHYWGYQSLPGRKIFTFSFTRFAIIFLLFWVLTSFLFRIQLSCCAKIITWWGNSPLLFYLY